MESNNDITLTKKVVPLFDWTSISLKLSNDHSSVSFEGGGDDKATNTSIETLNYQKVKVYIGGAHNSNIHYIKKIVFKDLKVINSGSSNEVLDSETISANLENRTIPYVNENNELYMVWLYNDNRYNYVETLKLCYKSGGSLIDLNNQNISTVKQFSMINFEKKIVYRIWISKENDCQTLILTENISRIQSTDCNDSFESICIVRKSDIFSYKIIGNIEENKKTLSLKTTNGYKFVSDDGFSLTYDPIKRIVSFKNGSNTGEEPRIRVKSFAEVFGRNTYHVGTSNRSIVLTITRCNPDKEFTCSNGDCLELKKVCDTKTDCLDSSDESICNHTEVRPSYYNKAISGTYIMFRCILKPLICV